MRGRILSTPPAAALAGFLLLAAVSPGTAGGADAPARRPAGKPPAGSSRAVPAEIGARPIDITADRLSADSAKDTVVFEGNVVARQEDVTLTADRVTAEYSRPSRAVDRIVAEGNVRVVHAGREAKGSKAVFFNIEQRIVLTGDAELTYEGNTLRGDAMTVYLRENRSVVTAGEGGRVRAVIQPKGIQEIRERTGQ